MCELRVAIGMAGAFVDLGGALQTVAQRMQQVSDGRGADRVALVGQGRRQSAQRQCGPAQRRNRIAASARLDQCLQRRQQADVGRHQRFAAAPGARIRSVGAGVAVSSEIPRAMVAVLAPEAPATRVIPPWPSVIASLAR